MSDAAGKRVYEVDEVVLGWKPAESADAALEWVLQRIDRLAAPLTLLTVLDAKKSYDDETRAKIESDAAAVADGVRAKHPSITVSTRLVEGDGRKLSVRLAVEKDGKWRQVSSNVLPLAVTQRRSVFITTSDAGFFNRIGLGGEVIKGGPVKIFSVED